MPNNCCYKQAPYIHFLQISKHSDFLCKMKKLFFISAYIIFCQNAGFMNCLKRKFTKPEAGKLELKYPEKTSASVTNVSLASCGNDSCAKVTEFAIADNNTFECREERIGILYNMAGHDGDFHGFIGQNDAIIHGVQAYGACTTFKRQQICPFILEIQK